MSKTVMTRRKSTQSTFAVRFFVTTLMVGAVAALLARILVQFAGHRASGFPLPFLMSTAFLGFGSWSLHCSIQHVRIERQRPFRRWLLIALSAGIGFVSTQSYALWWLLQDYDPQQVATGATAFVFVFAALHGLHFTVALMFLVFITLHAFSDRYDHEYYGGVQYCSWFWHALGGVWLAILGTLLISL